VIPSVRVIEHDDGYELDLSVQVCERPDGKLDQRGHYASLRARVCCNCGHTELLVANPDKLWDAYQKSQQESSALFA
jgi:hypothetical protein